MSFEDFFGSWAQISCDLQVVQLFVSCALLAVVLWQLFWGRDV